MRRHAPVALAGSLLALSISGTTAHAVVPRTQLTRPAADELTVLPAARAFKPLRKQRQFHFDARPTAAWLRFTNIAGASWRAAWDNATGVPSRMWGPGIAAPGAVASPAIAERLSRQLLADHLGLLAPGSRVEDFKLVSNTSAGGIRAVGFVQMSAGERVVGGQVSFRFKNDRLFVIASEALPDVMVERPRSKLGVDVVRARAVDNLRHELVLPGAPVTPAGDAVVLPLVGDYAVIGYRHALPMEIDGGAEGRYLAYVDPTSGAVLAVVQQNMYATGTVKYHGVDRYPARGRIDRPAQRAFIQLNSIPQTTTLAGNVSWSPDVAQTLTTGVTGQLVAIVNKGTGGALTSTQLTLSPGGSVVWDASADPEQDAQVVTYLAVNTVKEFVRTHIDSAMPKLDESMTANVNIPQNCNAFFDGKAVNFFHSTMTCQNTGLIDDVIYHEFGHALHTFEIIDGVGAFDGAMSEGAADFLAAQITNDSGMGRGFFFTDEPLRELDPTDSEARWPTDIGEIHKTGIIFGGAMWDLRKQLIADLGDAPGKALAAKLYVGALRRSVNIPSSMFEVLAEDDDDGDLTNGTPHECAIRSAYGRHGLRTATGYVTAPGALDNQAAATVVRIDLDGLATRCGGDKIDHVTLEWKPGFLNVPDPGSIEMTKVAGAAPRYWAQLPLASSGDVYYSAHVTFEDGSELTLADNLADTFYTLYAGNTVPLYCTSFDAEDPFQNGWEHGTLDGGTSPWEWGAPPGNGATDPPAAFSGDKVIGTKLGGDYPASLYSYVKMPDIDIGHYSDVRLQYRRWLAVEDSHYDAARVTVNNKQAYINNTQNMGDSSSLHTIDKEWRFQDVQLTGRVPGHIYKVVWDLATDEGLQLGGWHIDDVCVVASLDSICGDGVRSPYEQCDDGDANSDGAGSTCRTWCQKPQCGDGIIDTLEECDPGPDGSDDCSAQCTFINDDGGCCSSARGAGGSLVLAGLVLLGLRRRRRR